MNFCPICNKNYDTDVQNCTDCGCSLLAGNQEDFFTLFEDNNEELIMRLYNFLSEHDYNTAQYIEYIPADASSKDSRYLLIISTSEGFNAIQDILKFMEKTDSFFTDTLATKVSAQMNALLKDFIADEGSKQFVDAKTKYEDMMSSAQSLIAVSILGFIFELLVYANIIPLNMGILFYLFFSTMLSAFLILGIRSIFEAKAIKATTDEEASLSESIKTFLLEEFDTSELENSFSEDTIEEEKYFSRNQLAKEQVRKRFGDVDVLLIDSIFDNLYNELFSVTVQP